MIFFSIFTCVTQAYIFLVLPVRGISISLYLYIYRERDRCRYPVLKSERTLPTVKRWNTPAYFSLFSVVCSLKGEKLSRHLAGYVFIVVPCRGNMICQLKARSELRRSCKKNKPAGKNRMHERHVFCALSYTRTNSSVGVVP